MFAWPVSFWLIVQRLFTLYILIKRNHVTPIPKENRISLKSALKKGWKTLLLPVIMIAPFLFANVCGDGFIPARLGQAGGDSFSTFVLLTVPCVECAVVILLWRGKGNRVTAGAVSGMVSSGITTVAPIILMTFSGFAMGNFLNDLGMANEIVAQFQAIHVSRWAVILIAPLIFTFFGMFMESSACYFLFGPVFIPLAISVGINPMIAAMMVNVMCNAMGQMSPPLRVVPSGIYGHRKIGLQENIYAGVFLVLHSVYCNCFDAGRDLAYVRHGTLGGIFCETKTYLFHKKSFHYWHYRYADTWHFNGGAVYDSVYRWWSSC